MCLSLVRAAASKGDIDTASKGDIDTSPSARCKCETAKLYWALASDGTNWTTLASASAASPASPRSSCRTTCEPSEYGVVHRHHAHSSVRPRTSAAGQRPVVC